MIATHKGLLGNYQPFISFILDRSVDRLTLGSCLGEPDQANSPIPINFIFLIEVVAGVQ